MAIVIQYLDASQKPIKTAKYQAETLTLGRAFTNTCILDEPYISPEHLYICKTDQGFRVSDLQSKNGVTIQHRYYPSGSTIECNSGDVIHVGKLRLRVLRDDHLPAPTLALGKIEQALSRLISTPVVCLLTLFVLAFSGLKEEMLAPAPFEFSEFMRVNLAFFTVVLLWVGFWSLVTRLSKGEARFFDHFALVMLISAIYFVVELMLQIFQFNYPEIEVIKDLVVFTASFTFSILVFFHCILSTVVRGVVSKIGLFAFIFFIGFIIDLDDDVLLEEDVNMVDLQGGVLPDWALWRAPESITRFVEQAQKLDHKMNTAITEEQENP